eukprot:PhF_6_TR42194/c0_g1_i1/m.63854
MQGRSTAPQRKKDLVPLSGEAPRPTTLDPQHITQQQQQQSYGGGGGTYVPVSGIQPVVSPSSAMWGTPARPSGPGGRDFNRIIPPPSSSMQQQDSSPFLLGSGRVGGANTNVLSNVMSRGAPTASHYNYGGGGGGVFSPGQTNDYMMFSSPPPPGSLSPQGQAYPNPPTYRHGRAVYTFRDRMAASRVIQYAYRRYKRLKTERIRKEALWIVVDKIAQETIQHVVDEYLTDDITLFVLKYLQSREYTMYDQCLQIFVESLTSILIDYTKEALRETAEDIVTSTSTVLQKDALIELEKWMYGVYREGKPLRLPRQIQALPLPQLVDLKVTAVDTLETVLQDFCVEFVREGVREAAHTITSGRIHEEVVWVVVDEWLIGVLDPVLMDILNDEMAPYMTENLEDLVVRDILTEMIEGEYNMVVVAAEEEEFENTIARVTYRAEECVLMKLLCREFVRIVESGGADVLERHVTNSVMDLIVCGASAKVHANLLQSHHKISSYPQEVHRAILDLYDLTLLTVLCEVYEDQSTEYLNTVTYVPRPVISRQEGQEDNDESGFVRSREVSMAPSSNTQRQNGNVNARNTSLAKTNHYGSVFAPSESGGELRRSLVTTANNNNIPSSSNNNNSVRQSVVPRGSYLSPYPNTQLPPSSRSDRSKSSNK